jgi:hypothetical protein
MSSHQSNLKTIQHKNSFNDSKIVIQKILQLTSVSKIHNNQKKVELKSNKRAQIYQTVANIN